MSAKPNRVQPRFDLTYEPAKHVRRCLECLKAEPHGRDVYCYACRKAMNCRGWDNVGKEALR